MITGPVYVSLFYLLPCLFASFFVLLYINSSLVEKNQNLIIKFHVNQNPTLKYIE